MTGSWEGQGSGHSMECVLKGTYGVRGKAGMWVRAGWVTGDMTANSLIRPHISCVGEKTAWSVVRGVKRTYRVGQCESVTTGSRPGNHSKAFLNYILILKKQLL